MQLPLAGAQDHGVVVWLLMLRPVAGPCPVPKDGVKQLDYMCCQRPAAGGGGNAGITLTPTSYSLAGKLLWDGNLCCNSCCPSCIRWE